jgi:predicted adenylyl cyclase CyaB
MIEVEIRAKVKDFEQVKSNLQKINAKFVKQEKQADHIFGREKDLDDEHKILEGCFVARIREKGLKKLIEFKEVNRGGVGMEFSSPLASIESGFNFLAKLDFKKAFSLIKTREVYSYQDFEICLDEVAQLGCFIEIEHSSQNDGDKSAEIKACQDLMSKIAPGAMLEPKKYGDLMQELINKSHDKKSAKNN